MQTNYTYNKRPAEQPLWPGDNQMGARINLQTIINYVENMFKIQQQQQIIEDVKVEEYKLLYLGKSRSLTNLPNNLKLIFNNLEESTSRCGITTKKVERCNPTFFKCLLYCLDPEYISLSEDTKNKQTTELKSHLAYNIKHSKLFDLFKYQELKWKRKIIIDDIATNNITMLIIKYIIDYFNINMFIIDVPNDILTVCYSDASFDVYKNTIIMSLCEDVYEPVYNLGNSFWKYSDENYRRLLENITKNINFIDVIDFNPKTKQPKTFVIEETLNLTSYLTHNVQNNKYHLCIENIQITKSTTNKIKSNQIASDFQDGNTNSQNQYDEILCSEVQEVKIININQDYDTETEFCPGQGIMIIKENNDEPTINDLKKMKLDELIKVAENINIISTIKNGKYKTKNQLIIEINDYYRRRDNK